MRSRPALTSDLRALRGAWALAVATSLALAPVTVRAQEPSAAAEPKTADGSPTPDAQPEATTAQTPAETQTPAESDAAAPESETATETTAEPDTGPTDAPPASAVPKLADPEPEEPDAEPQAEQAEPEPEPDEDAEDEEAAEDPLPPGVPERLPPLQQAGWWTVFGAFVVGTTAGVFAGLAERQEDKATRLASRFDLTTQAQLLYEDERDEYEKLLRRGEAFQNTAIGLGVASGAILIAAATLFLVDRRRSRKGSPQRAKVTPRVGGFEVKF